MLMKEVCRPLALIAANFCTGGMGSHKFSCRPVRGFDFVFTQKPQADACGYMLPPHSGLKSAPLDSPCAWLDAKNIWPIPNCDLRVQFHPQYHGMTEPTFFKS